MKKAGPHREEGRFSARPAALCVVDLFGVSTVCMTRADHGRDPGPAQRGQSDRQSRDEVEIGEEPHDQQKQTETQVDEAKASPLSHHDADACDREDDGPQQTTPEQQGKEEKLRTGARVRNCDKGASPVTHDSNIVEAAAKKAGLSWTASGTYASSFPRL